MNPHDRIYALGRQWARLDALRPGPIITNIEAPEGYNMTDRQLYGFITGRGVTYLCIDQIISVSAVVEKKGQLPSRRVLFSGGGMDYIHNVRENFELLKHLLPDGTKPWDTPKAATEQEPRKGRKRR